MTTTFTESIVIEAPREQVWATLADIGSIHEWNDGVAASHQTSTGECTLGATRHCDLTNKMTLEEEVVEFEPGERITLRIVGGRMPFATAVIRFDLRDASGGTRVDVSPSYRMKYGPLGAIMDRLGGRRMYRKGMRDLLAGLKAHVEAPFEAFDEG